MLTADVIKDYVQTVMRNGRTTYQELETLFEPMVEQGRADIIAEGIPASEVTIERLLDMRYQGQSYELTVPLTPNFVGDFHVAHALTYGYSEPTVPVEIVNLRLRATGRLPCPPLPKQETGPPNPAAALFDRRPVVLAGGITKIPFYHGPHLQPGHQIRGPAVIVHPDTTIFIERGDRLTMDKYRNLLIKVKWGK
jgi:N-methylhydantoinase A